MQSGGVRLRQAKGPAKLQQAFGRSIVEASISSKLPCYGGCNIQSTIVTCTRAQPYPVHNSSTPARHQKDSDDDSATMAADRLNSIRNHIAGAADSVLGNDGPSSE